MLTWFKPVALTASFGFPGNVPPNRSLRAPDRRDCRHGRPARLPLDGTRVVAFETGLAGPLCSRLLAGLGAEVVKVERPGVGDVTRGWDTAVRGLSSGFVWVNRGKRSVTLDVKDPAARPAIERLVARSDVFLHNFSPGWAERMALDATAVRRLRPDIVYTEIRQLRADGPVCDKERLRPRHAG